MSFFLNRNIKPFEISGPSRKAKTAPAGFPVVEDVKPKAAEPVVEETGIFFIFSC